MNKLFKHLKSQVVSNNIIISSKIKRSVRSFLENREFIEYDTPILSARTGEIYNSTFEIEVSNCKAMLSDSPQIFKMLLVLTQNVNYFQFAHCFRPIEHEKDIHTRLCEFTQIDLEMKVDTLYELIGFAKKLLSNIFKAIKIDVEFKSIDGIECHEKYGDEMKPRFDKKDGVTVLFIEKMPLTNGEKTGKNTLIPCHHIFALPSDNVYNSTEVKLENRQTESFDIVINGIEVGGGDLRIMDAALQTQMMNIFSVEKSMYADYLQILSIKKYPQIGGFAIGLERLIMAVTNCKNIRETTYFPEIYKGV